MEDSESEALQPGNNLLVKLEGEDHTFGNVLREVMWMHPHIQLSSYTKEHPNLSEILIRCQTNGVVSAEQGMVESLHLAKEVLMHVEDTMAAAVKRFQQQQQQQ
uniref:DNA-directed RNA polymerase RBP11-like dimerisation domain-containing protein n=1 Tax=Auxenochlorella protothecoides TaxID=3075 RepID=A0A1D1ZVL8_AUXPR